MFDGIDPGKRRQMTERERKTLMRMEHNKWLADVAVWEAERQAQRVTRKFERYAERLNQRLGPGGYGSRGSDLITEWLVHELSKSGPDDAAG